MNDEKWIYIFALGTIAFACGLFAYVCYLDTVDNMSDNQVKIAQIQNDPNYARE